MLIKSKKFQILLGVIAVLVVIRAILPTILLPPINNYLKDFSKVYTFHISDLDLSILRGAYRFEGITGRMHTKKENFLDANFVDVSISWRELLRGRVLTDVVADGINFKLSQELLAGVKKQSADAALEEGKQAKNKLFPVNIARIDVKNSEFLFADAPGIPPELQLHITGFEAQMNNVTATDDNLVSLIVGRGSLMNSGLIKVVGQLNQGQKPIEWDFDVELKGFELTKLNEFLKRRGPLTLETGKADIYSEIKSENDKITGYIKPFIHNAHFVGDSGDFKGIKHFGIEITTATVNEILKNQDNKSVGTRILFTYDKAGFDWDASHAISTAIAHGFRDKLEPGIENVFAIDATKPKEIAHD